MLTKFAIIFSFLVVYSLSVFTQDCKMYFPVKEGTEMEIKNYNDKDKLTGSTLQKISKIEEDGNNMTIIVDHESFDKKGEKLMAGEFEVRCVDGTFYMDMRNMLDEATLSAYEGMEIEVDANDMAYTQDMKAGASLPDANITVSASSNGMKMFTMTVFVTNRKVSAKESITTPAGSFECLKISFDIETKMMVKVQAKAVQWIAEDIGVVKTETFNKKGKMQGYSVLTNLN